MRTILTIVIIFGLAVVLVSSAAMVFQKKKKKVTKAESFRQINKRFNFYYDFALTRHLFRKMFQQIGNLSVYNYMESRIVTVQQYEKSVGTSILIFIVGIIGFQDLVSAVLAFMFADVILQNNINNKIDDINFRTYRAMSNLLNGINETYILCHSIPDTLNDCPCPEILQLQVQKIYKICTDNDGRHLLSAFYEECPNRTMRTLATTCYIRNDTGDDKAEGSPFRDAIDLIKDEVDSEYMRQLHQRLMFAKLDKMTFIPIVLYPILVLAYSKILPATQAVFQSFWGYLIKLAVILSSLACFYVLSTMNNASCASIDDRNDLYIEAMRHSKIRTFAQTLVPRNFRKRHKVEEELLGCLSSKDIQYLYFEKFCDACIFAVAAVIMSIFILIASRSSIYKSTQAITMTSTLSLTKSEKKALEEYDATMLAQPEAPDDSDGSVTKSLQSILPRASAMDLESQVTRVQDKYKTYHNLHFWWWFAFLYMGAAALGWIMPNQLLKIRVSLVKEEATIDVLQLQTVIAILMDTTMDTLSVIYWLMRSSDIHKDILADCYNEYPCDPIRALNNLKSKVTLPMFVQMCESLKVTVYQTSLAEAFDNLVKDRKNVLKQRELVQEAELKAKRNKASPVALFPMAVWVVTCFVMPIIIITVNSALSMFSRLKTMF